MEPATNSTKFTFDTVFADARDIVSDAARARQKKIMTVAAIEQLRAEAEQAGRNAGEILAQQQIAADVQALTQSIHDALAQSAEAIEAVRSDAATLALAAARKLARAAIAAAPQDEVELALREAMHQAIGEPRIILRVNPALAEALARNAEDIAHDEAFDGRVQIKPEPHLNGADCRIEWRGGGAEHLQAVIDSALSELIARRFSTPPQTDLTKE